MAITPEEQEMFTQATKNIIDSFIEAIDAHAEEGLAEVIKSQAGLNVMAKTLELIKKEQERLVVEAKAQKAGSQDANPFLFPGGMTSWPDERF